MGELLGQLGVNWKLLVSQGVNFFVILTVLTFFVYRPLIKTLEERRKRIESGLRGASEAERRLLEIEELKVKRLSAADKEALSIVSQAEREAGAREEIIMKEAEGKAARVLTEAEALALRKKKEELEQVFREAGEIVKSAIAKAVELDPAKIDEALIKRATETVKEKLA